MAYPYGDAKTWTGVDPASSRAWPAGLAELERLVGRSLTAEERAEAQKLVGYTDPTGAATLTGTQFNTLLTEGAKRSGATFTPWSSATTTTAPKAPTKPAFSFTAPPAYTAPAYQAPGAFVAPSTSDLNQDPGYQFRLSQGAQALQNSASARGVLRTGGTLKDLLNYGQNAASQEYANIYGREKDVYNSGVANEQARYQAALEGSQAEYAPQLLGWQAKMAADQRAAELEFDRTWQKTIYDNDDAWRKDQFKQTLDFQKYTYGTDDEFRKQVQRESEAWKREVLVEERLRFLATLGR